MFELKLIDLNVHNFSLLKVEVLGLGGEVVATTFDIAGAGVELLTNT